MEKTAEQLAKVDFLDIYEEIAEIPILDEQVVKMCITIPCKVDLRKVNLVYLVEQKYKDKLSTYKKSKILKWLNVNLPRLLPNPEAKYLRWHERHQRSEKIEWINRKAQAVQQLPQPQLISVSPDFEREYGETSGVGLVNKTQLIDSATPPSNSTAGTIETVIPSEPKSTQQIMSGFLGLIEASNTTIESNELPPPFSNTVSSTQGSDREPVEPCANQSRVEKNEHLLAKVVPKKIMFQQSEDFSSQDDPYTSFSLDNMVTSTQEFG